MTSVRIKSFDLGYTVVQKFSFIDLGRRYNVANFTQALRSGSPMRNGTTTPIQWFPALLAVFLGAFASGSAHAQESAWTFLPGQPLFAPLIADPREPKIGFIPYLTEQGYEGSLGGTLEIIRWKSAPDLRWAFGLSAGLWTLTEYPDLTGLLATDWYSAAFIDCRTGPWSFRAEFQDQKSNLGDALEGIRAFTYYALDFYTLTASLDVSPDLRIYAGGGYKLFWEFNTDFDPTESQTFAILGFQAYSQPFTLASSPCRLYGAYHFKYQRIVGETFDHSAQLGLEFPGQADNRVGVRLALVYYAGRSEFGQFYTQYDQHLGLGLFIDP